MSLYFVIAAWALLEILQEAEISYRRTSPSVVFVFIREAGEILLLLILSASILHGILLVWPPAQGFLIALGFMAAYFYAQYFKRRETIVFMAFAVATSMAAASLSVIFWRSLLIAAGLLFMKFILKGIQKRQWIAPMPALFSGIPGMLMTASLVALVLSALFIP